MAGTADMAEPQQGAYPDALDAGAPEGAGAAAASPAPAAPPAPARRLRFAAVGDLHCTKDMAGRLRGLFAAAAEAADALLLCGDLTDYGLPEEAKVLADELAVAALPIVAVLGNHDFESGRPD